jgi:hypothetical protein
MEGLLLLITILIFINLLVYICNYIFKYLYMIIDYFVYFPIVLLNILI